MFDLHSLYVEPLDDGSFVLPDGFAHLVVGSLEEARAMATERGREQEQTDDVPVELVFQYADAAVQYVFDYAEEIIDLQTRALALQQVPRSSRSAPGEAIARLATFLSDELSRPNSGLLELNQKSYGSIAKACSINVTSIYKKRYKTLILKASLAYKRGVEERVELIAEFRQLAASQRRVVRQQTFPDRKAAIRVGLPYYGRSTGTAAPWPVTHVYSSRASRTTIERAVADLWTSIYIILFAFLAERTEQAQSLRTNCLESGIDGWYIRTLVFKGRNDVSGSAVKLACPDIVARAVSVATKLGATARASSGSTYLLCEKNRHKQSVIDQTTLRKRMADFGSRYVAGEDAHQVKFVPRHLRRFFVTLWVHYYRFGGKFGPLQKHLGHNDLTTTILYGTRVTRIDAAREEQTRLTLRLFGEFVDDATSFLGAGSKQIESILARLEYRVSPPDALLNKLEATMRDRSMRVYPLPFGYCLWHDQAAVRAKCRREGTSVSEWPDVGKTETLCGDCGNFFTLPVFLDFWERAVERHEKTAKDKRAPQVLRRLGNVGKRIASRYVRSIRGQG